MQAGDIKVFKTAEKKHTGRSDYSDCDSYCSDDDSDCGPATDLNCMMLNTSPAENEWIDVEDGVSLKRCEPPPYTYIPAPIHEHTS